LKFHSPFLQVPLRRVHPAHDLEAFHLLRHERRPVQRAGVVRLRLQQVGDVAERADRDDHHAAVRLVREDAAVGGDRVGVVFPAGESARVAPDDLGGEPFVIEEARVLQRRHRDVGASEPRVDRVEAGGDFVGGRAADGRQQLHLAPLYHPVQEEQRADVVAVVVHVGVEDDACRRLGSLAEGWTAGRRKPSGMRPRDVECLSELCVGMVRNI
jgi:hypothetical protein